MKLVIYGEFAAVHPRADTDRRVTVLHRKFVYGQVSDSDHDFERFRRVNATNLCPDNCTSIDFIVEPRRSDSTPKLLHLKVASN